MKHYCKGLQIFKQINVKFHVETSMKMQKSEIWIEMEINSMINAKKWIKF